MPSLVELDRWLGREARPDFERYAKRTGLYDRLTLCRAFDETHADWAMPFLAPMLTDKRMVLGHTRLCDEAAGTLSDIFPDLKLPGAKDREDLDRQIKAMLERIAKQHK